MRVIFLENEIKTNLKLVNLSINFLFENVFENRLYFYLEYFRNFLQDFYKAKSLSLITFYIFNRKQMI